jgi:hypothetical protein
MKNRLGIAYSFSMPMIRTLSGNQLMAVQLWNPSSSTGDLLVYRVKVCNKSDGAINPIIVQSVSALNIGFGAAPDKGYAKSNKAKVSVADVMRQEVAGIVPPSSTFRDGFTLPKDSFAESIYEHPIVIAPGTGLTVYCDNSYHVMVEFMENMLNIGVINAPPTVWPSEAISPSLNLNCYAERVAPEFHIANFIHSGCPSGSYAIYDGNRNLVDLSEAQPNPYQHAQGGAAFGWGAPSSNFAAIDEALYVGETWTQVHLESGTVVNSVAVPHCVPGTSA